MMKTKFTLLAAVAAAGLALAGCSSGTATPDGNSTAPATSDSTGGLPTDPITVRLAEIPYSNMAPVKIAEEQGKFQDAGITVETTDFNNGAQVIQALAAGQADVGYVGSISAVQAVDKGLPIVTFSNSDVGTTQGIYVLASSDIKTGKDLEGKTIAVSGIGGLADITSRAPLEAEGVDWSKVKLVQVAPDAQEQALGSGQVDAVWFSEPQQTLAAKDLGTRQITKMLQGPTEGMATGIWVANADYAKNNLDDLKRFNKVLGDAMRFANDNPDEVAAILPSFTGLTPELAALVKMIWVPDGTGGDYRQALTILNDLGAKYGYISKPIDLNAFVVDASS